MPAICRLHWHTRQTCTNVCGLKMFFFLGDVEHKCEAFCSCPSIIASVAYTRSQSLDLTFGNLTIKSWAFAILHTYTICSSEICGLPRRRFPSTVSLKRQGSCNEWRHHDWTTNSNEDWYTCCTIPIVFRNHSIFNSRTSSPSKVTRPASGSYRRVSRPTEVDLPQPEWPTSATVWPGSMTRFRPLRTWKRFSWRDLHDRIDSVFLPSRPFY